MRISAVGCHSFVYRILLRISPDSDPSLSLLLSVAPQAVLRGALTRKLVDISGSFFGPAGLHQVRVAATPHTYVYVIHPPSPSLPQPP